MVAQRQSVFLSGMFNTALCCWCCCCLRLRGCKSAESVDTRPLLGSREASAKFELKIDSIAPQATSPSAAAHFVRFNTQSASQSIDSLASLRRQSRARRQRSFLAIRSSSLPSPFVNTRITSRLVETAQQHSHGHLGARAHAHLSTNLLALKVRPIRSSKLPCNTHTHPLSTNTFTIFTKLYFSTINVRIV